MVNAIASFALIAGSIGILATSQATFGVGLVALGCLLAILARIVQAERHHRAKQSPKEPDWVSKV